jgi:hypothetical protein
LHLTTSRKPYNWTEVQAASCLEQKAQQADAEGKWWCNGKGYKLLPALPYAGIASRIKTLANHFKKWVTVPLHSEKMG